MIHFNGLAPGSPGASQGTPNGTHKHPAIAGRSRSGPWLPRVCIWAQFTGALGQQRSGWRRRPDAYIDDTFDRIDDRFGLRAIDRFDLGLIANSPAGRPRGDVPWDQGGGLSEAQLGALARLSMVFSDRAWLYQGLLGAPEQMIRANAPLYETNWAPIFDEAASRPQSVRVAREMLGVTGPLHANDTTCRRLQDDVGVEPFGQQWDEDRNGPEPILLMRLSKTRAWLGLPKKRIPTHESLSRALEANRERLPARGIVQLDGRDIGRGAALADSVLEVRTMHEAGLCFAALLNCPRAILAAALGVPASDLPPEPSPKKGAA